MGRGSPDESFARWRIRPASVEPDFLPVGDWYGSLSTDPSVFGLRLVDDAVALARAADLLPCIVMRGTGCWSWRRHVCLAGHAPLVRRLPATYLGTQLSDWRASHLRRACVRRESSIVVPWVEGLPAVVAFSLEYAEGSSVIALRTGARVHGDAAHLSGDVTALASAQPPHCRLCPDFVMCPHHEVRALSAHLAALA